MGRQAEDFLLRNYSKSPFWYYRLKGWKNFKSTGLKTKAEAKSFAIEKWKKLEDKDNADFLFGEIATDFFLWDSPWCTRQQHKQKIQKSTGEWRQLLLTKHIEPRFNNLPLSSITPGIIDSWLCSLNLSSQTKEHIRTTLRIIFREAVRERHITFNPMDYVEREKIVHNHNEPPTMEELRKLFPQNLNKFKEIWPMHHYGVMCIITATTGLRMQEVRALTPKSISIEKQGIIVVQAVKVTGEIGSPKQNEIRVVLVPKETIELLKWWISESKARPDKLYIQNGNLMRKYKYPRIEQVFTSPLVNDYNLHLCGGWSWSGVSNDECITRVLEYAKPMGYLHTDKDYPSMVEDRACVIKATSANDEIGYSITGTFGEVFDLDALATDYIHFFEALGNSELNNQIYNSIQTLKDLPISRFLGGYDYANPQDMYQLILTGLILGYPIETTFSIIWDEFRCKKKL